jgi:hypothetical protein
LHGSLSPGAVVGESKRSSSLDDPERRRWTRIWVLRTRFSAREIIDTDIANELIFWVERAPSSSFDQPRRVFRQGSGVLGVKIAKFGPVLACS